MRRSPRRNRMAVSTRTKTRPCANAINGPKGLGAILSALLSRDAARVFHDPLSQMSGYANFRRAVSHVFLDRSSRSSSSSATIVDAFLRCACASVAAVSLPGGVHALLDLTHPL
ncbi:hypothetical protein MRX96_048094 [Rhipicephalus microplus]